MNGLRVACVWLVVSVCFVQGGAQTQTANILTRESDEIARTRDERQHVLSVLLDAARQTRETEPVKAAGFLNRAARLQLRLTTSETALALATYRDALSLLDRSPDAPTRIATLNGIAAVFVQLGKCGLATPLIDQVIVLSRKSGSVAGEAEALLTLSECQELQPSLQTLGRSLQMFQSIGHKMGTARAYELLSDTHLTGSNLVEATKNNEAALRIFQELNIPDEQASCFINYGFIEYRKGAWQECIAYLTQARGLLDEAAEPLRMGQISAGIAEAFMESGIPDAGLTKAKEALEYFRRAEDAVGIVAASWDVGKAYYLLGDYPAAIEALRQTMNHAEEAGVLRIVAFCHDYIGRTYAATGEQDRALQEFQTALQLFDRLRNPREAARTRVLIGNVHAWQGEVDKARRQYQLALEAFNKQTDPVNQSASLYALGKLELSLNNLDAADDYLNRSIELTENIRRLSTTADLMTAVSGTIHDRYESYIDCLMRKHEQQPEKGFAVRAFELSELSRARALAYLLRATQTNLVTGVDRELSAQEKSLRQSLHAKENVRLNLLGDPKKEQELKAVQTDLADLETQYAQVRERIRTLYPAYEQITRPTTMTLEQLRAEVLADDENLLLEYSLGDERSYLWAVSRTEFSSYRLPARDEINRTAQKLYSSLSAPPSMSAQSATDPQLSTEILELSRVLLGPVAEKLPNKRLIIVADGAFQLIPFQVLVSPSRSTENSNAIALSESSRPLALDHEIVNQPSASTLALLLRESADRKPANGSVAIFADPVFGADDPRILATSNATRTQTANNQPSLNLSAASRDLERSFDAGALPRLLASRDEAEAITKVVPSHTSFKALDFEANRATISTPTLAQHRVLHFATHALLNDRPQMSGIVLSRFNAQGEPQNGFLQMSDIYALNLPVDLVVLSACQTGIGKEVRGEGLIGLTRGFMYAGAGGVAASLWKVDDEATAELMKMFYKGMFQDGLTPAAALRQAQIAMWQQKRWRAPYFWAAFTIQGRYDQNHLSFSSSRAQWTVTLAGLGSAFLLAAFLILGRRRNRIV